MANITSLQRLGLDVDEGRLQRRPTTGGAASSRAVRVAARTTLSKVSFLSERVRLTAQRRERFESAALEVRRIARADAALPVVGVRSGRSSSTLSQSVHSNARLATTS